MAAASGTPFSSLRMFSCPSSTPRRLVANPDESRTTTAVLPSDSTQSAALPRIRSAVRAVVMISPGRMTRSHEPTVQVTHDERTTRTNSSLTKDGFVSSVWVRVHGLFPPTQEGHNGGSP